jgi:hypothetical protein
MKAEFYSHKAGDLKILRNCRRPNTEFPDDFTHTPETNACTITP